MQPYFSLESINIIGLGFSKLPHTARTLFVLCRITACGK
jgi:hypothetical protein